MEMLEESLSCGESGQEGVRPEGTTVYTHRTTYTHVHTYTCAQTWTRKLPSLRRPRLLSRALSHVCCGCREPADVQTWDLMGHPSPPPRPSRPRQRVPSTARLGAHWVWL